MNWQAIAIQIGIAVAKVLLAALVGYGGGEVADMALGSQGLSEGAAIALAGAAGVLQEKPRVKKV